jgi:two-component system chemotaxis response regulator CheY
MERNDVTGTRPFKCLVVDDSQFARTYMGRIIQKMGGEVVGEAERGDSAVELFTRHHPDLVLLDITMPEMDGVEALRRIRERDGAAKVIIVSALGHKEMVWQAMKGGATHFITKPFTTDYAELIIRSVLAEGAGGAT